jgi:hypothetical protein
MFDEPDEDQAENALDPAQRAKEKADEFAMYAELAAVFEGPRKFEAQVLTKLDAGMAREIQRGMARLERAKTPGNPILPPEMAGDAAGLLDSHHGHGMGSNDYHVHRRPGEVMMVRWLEGEQVETFYERIQAHFDVAMEDYRSEERQTHGWKQDPKTLEYLSALDGVEVKMAEKYLREPIRKHGLFVLSTQTADEISIAYLCDYVMGMPAAEVVGKAAAPPENPTEQDLAWFFKLFALRGMKGQEQRMCFFAYLQKSDEGFGDEPEE